MQYSVSIKKEKEPAAATKTCQHAVLSSKSFKTGEKNEVIKSFSSSQAIYL